MLDRLYLVRHAEPLMPGGRRLCLGRRLDVPLSETGRAQALALAPQLQAVGAAMVFTSPLLRAAQTAALIAGDRLPVTVLPDLTEADGGAWDGLPFEEIRRRYPAYFMSGADAAGAPPGGEADEAALTRMLNALAQIEARAEGVAIAVTHAGVGRILLAHCMGLPLNRRREIALPCAGVARLARRGAGWMVEAAPR